MANIGDLNEYAKEMKAQGKTMDEIANILNIDVRWVRAFLEEKEG